jgi:hypothetical protein
VFAGQNAGVKQVGDWIWLGRLLTVAFQAIPERQALT